MSISFLIGSDEPVQGVLAVFTCEFGRLSGPRVIIIGCPMDVLYSRVCLSVIDQNTPVALAAMGLGVFSRLPGDGSHCWQGGGVD